VTVEHLEDVLSSVEMLVPQCHW